MKIGGNIRITVQMIKENAEKANNKLKERRLKTNKLDRRD